MLRVLLAMLLLGCAEAAAEPSTKAKTLVRKVPPADSVLIDAIMRCEPPSPTGATCGGNLMLIRRLTPGGARKDLVLPRTRRNYTRHNGASMTLVTRKEYEARLTATPDSYVSSLSVTLDWVDDATISVTTFGRRERLSDRAKHIAVGVSGCVDVHYDVVARDGVWTCGKRENRVATSPACAQLFRSYVAALKEPPVCAKPDECTADHCEWASSPPNDEAGQFEATLMGFGCGEIRFTCPASGAMATPRLVLD